VIPLIPGVTWLEAAMMGRQNSDQASLFYAFRLDDRVPKDHLLRRIDVFVMAALGGMHARLKPYYSEIGRPSIDPELMIRMLIIGYCYGLRSERRLTQEVDLHLAYRWFCRLDLDDKVPHHSTFSENRLHRFRESDVFRHIFERIVTACMAAGLVKGEGFAVDASVMEANASRYHGKAPDEIVWAEPARQTRAVKEYLAGLEAEAELNPDRKPPKVISPSDPCSAWTAKANKRVQFGYGLNYLIDIENAVIVDVEATPARTYDEVAATKSMIERTDKRFGLKPKHLAADTAYGTGKFLGWLIGAGISPHIPVWDKSTREDGTLSRSDFRWHKRRGVYVCPNNKVLHTSGTVHDGRTLLYRASKLDCDICPLKARCCPGQLARKIPRDVHEDARDMARRLMGSKAFIKSRDERKRVEMRFAHLKIQHGFERMRLRGLSARATNSISLLSCRTSRPWRSEPSGHRLPYIPRRLRNRQQGSGNFKGQGLPVLQSNPISSRICRLNGSPIENTDFFDSIDPKRSSMRVAKQGPLRRWLFDSLVGKGEELVWNLDAERLGSLQVDLLVLCRRLHRKVSRLLGLAC
jgi:transposase